MQSSDSASSPTSLRLLQPGILWVLFLGCVHWYQTGMVFCYEIWFGCTPAFSLYDLGSFGPEQSCVMDLVPGTYQHLGGTAKQGRNQPLWGMLIPEGPLLCTHHAG